MLLENLVHHHGNAGNFNFAAPVVHRKQSLSMGIGQKHDVQIFALVDCLERVRQVLNVASLDMLPDDRLLCHQANGIRDAGDVLAIDLECGTQVKGKNILHLRQAPMYEAHAEQGPDNTCK